MIDAGRAFSGNERNCCFLNSRDGRFADLSAGSGLDFPDDGRGVAVTDWDQDGDLDLWISNRNAPRLRLMRNGAGGGNRSIALQLIGNGESCNRDAIGARVELKLRDQPAGVRHVRSLRAGEGFLSQSSKWLHFGLGKGDRQIESIAIRWPDGSSETLSGFEVGSRYRIQQSSGQAEEVPKRDAAAIKLMPSVQKVAAAKGGARIPVVTLLRAPKLNLKRSDGSLALPGGGRSRLINLWATWCAPCVKELEHFRDHSDELRAAGVDVLAINVDGVGEAIAGGQDPAELIARLKFPFPSIRATEPLVAALQDLHNRVVGLNRPLPVPTSFLVDPQGRLSVIYKGSVSAEQIIADLGHSSGTLADRFARAAQLRGSSIALPEVLRTADQQEASIQHRYGLVVQSINDLDSAIYHYESALALDPNLVASSKQLAQIHAARRDWKAGVETLEVAVKHAPQDFEVHHLLAQLYARLGDAAAATRHYEAALELNPQHALANFGLAALHDARGDAARAIPLYRRGLSAQPSNRLAVNNLAWILATHPDGSVRDPAEAKRLAEKLNEATGDQLPHVLDTLAAAEAAAGNYQVAVRLVERAIELVESASNQPLSDDLSERLTIYKSEQPFIEKRFLK